MPRSKKLGLLAIKLVFLMCYIPLAAEVMVRMLDPVPMLPRYVCAMSYGIRGNAPNRSYWHKTAEYKVNIKTNSRGIRADREIPYEKPEGLKRIVLLGDSFGMGYGVSKEQMFTSRMLYYLDTLYGIKAEVVNLATSGHGNAEELIVLENEGLKYNPDLVLLAWHPTDISDNVRSNLFRLTDEGLVRQADQYLPAVEVREKLERFWIYRFLAEKSQLYNMTRDWAGRTVQSLLVKVRSVKAKKEPEEKQQPKYSAIDLTAALLLEIDKQASESGAEFLVLDIPRRISRSEFVSKFPQEIQSVLGNIVSPVDVFLDEGEGRKIYWERSHNHFTPLGCDIVGRMLAEHIVENELFEGE